MSHGMRAPRDDEVMPRTLSPDDEVMMNGMTGVGPRTPPDVSQDDEVMIPLGEVTIDEVMAEVEVVMKNYDESALMMNSPTSPEPEPKHVRVSPNIPVNMERSSNACPAWCPVCPIKIEPRETYEVSVYHLDV